jgi:hypothetical protein
MSWPFLPERPEPIVDAHVHVYDDANVDAVLEAATRFGVRRLFTSCLGPPPLNYSPPAEDVRRFNEVVARAVSRYPEHFVGYCYVNPCQTEGALADFRRGVEEQTLRGLKLWMACHCDDPRVFPLVEQAVAYRLPILIHAWSKVGGSLPTESEAEHVAALARRFPEARIVMAHMSGDWLVKLRLIRDCPNVHVDTSGIDPEEGQVETAVAMLGPSRVLFGSDIPIRDLGSQIAKILGAELDEAARRLVLHGNVERLIEGGAR